MRNTRKMGWVLSAAVAAVGVGVLASSAVAQQRVGSDGRALDANNRVGSGGVNEPGYAGPPHVTGNQIVTGNVTAGREFRGAVPYTDPFAFRGVTAGVGSDRFIRNTAGVPIAGLTGNDNASIATPFYGQSQTVQRPPGYALEAPGTGFVPAAALSREPGDLRLGRPFDAPVVMLPQPGQLILPGPVDPNTQQASVITASPLYGVRQWDLTEEGDQQFLRGLQQAGSMRARLDDRTLQRMRDELLGTPEEERLDTTPDPTRDLPRDSIDGRMDQPIGAPQDLPLSERARIQDRNDSTRATGDITTRQRRMIHTAPEVQSTQVAELRRRLDRFNRLPESITELQEHRRRTEEARVDRESPGVGETRDRDTGFGLDTAPGTRPPAGFMDPPIAQQPDTDTKVPGMDTGIPGLPRADRDALPDAQGDEPARTQVPGAIRDTTTPQREQPLQITSLATGIQAKGLSDFLREAETLMKEGKFYSALDQYDMAEQVAANNPMVPLGRAIAELGAGYYNRAEQHLREAFTKDPSLLLGQYDLRGFLGTERLEFIDKDLKAVANVEQREARPVFLLAFINYNTGREQMAAAYLDLAEKRAGRNDPFYQLLREHWSLPRTQQSAPDDSNK